MATGASGSTTLGNFLPGRTTSGEAVSLMDHARSVLIRRHTWSVMQQMHSRMSKFMTNLETSQNYEMITEVDPVTWYQKKNDITATPFEALKYKRRAVFTLIYHAATSVSLNTLAESDKDYFGDWDKQKMYSEAALVDSVALKALIEPIQVEKEGPVQPGYTGTTNVPIRASMDFDTFRPDITFIMTDTKAAYGSVFGINQIIRLRYLLRKRHGSAYDPMNRWCITLTPAMEHLLFSDTTFQNRYNIYSNMMNGAGPQIGMPFSYLGFQWVPVEDETMPDVDTSNIASAKSGDEVTLFVRNASDTANNTDNDALRGRLVKAKSSAFPGSDTDLRAAAQGLINQYNGSTPDTAANGGGTYKSISVASKHDMAYCWQPAGLVFLTRHASFVDSPVFDLPTLSYAKGKYAAVCFGAVRVSEDRVVAFPIRAKNA